MLAAMSAAYFDTLALSKKLRGQFTPEQAETLAEAFVAGVNEQLATKTDLTELELRMEARFAQLEGKLESRVVGLATKIAESANRMLMWIVGAIFSSAALIIAIEKLLP